MHSLVINIIIHFIFSAEKTEIPHCLPVCDLCVSAVTCTFTVYCEFTEYIHCTA